MSQPVRTAPVQVSGDLYAEVRTFYAWQMRRVDSLDIDGFAATFTEDGVVVHSNGAKAEGREQMIEGMRRSLPRYRDIAPRHWFEHLLIEPVEGGEEGELKVSYYTLVALTDRAGGITFEPTFTVEDVLVRRDGRLLTKYREIHRDAPAEQ
ncbi:nuclear transport factor 2 family protein [Kitasatospora sp. NPDC051170]|uniref:nuclear transport factor 2 family protein n=1 Tax=Kitasatospora sp. NPDC051170 TaxID=3364056 RepID=UPI00378997EB